MIDHLGQLWNARFQGFLAVLIKEKLRISQARANHALITLNNRTRIGGRNIADDQEFIGQFARRIQQREILLIRLHRENQALLRHIEELFFKFADQHIRALDQSRDFIEQCVVINGLATTTNLHCCCSQLLGNFSFTCSKTGNHRAVFFQHRRIAVRIRNHHWRFCRFKAVALRRIACGQAQRRHWHNLRTM